MAKFSKLKKLIRRRPVRQLNIKEAKREMWLAEKKVSELKLMMGRCERSLAKGNLSDEQVIKLINLPKAAELWYFDMKLKDRCFSSRARNRAVKMRLKKVIEEGNTKLRELEELGDDAVLDHILNELYPEAINLLELRIRTLKNRL